MPPKKNVHKQRKGQAQNTPKKVDIKLKLKPKEPTKVKSKILSIVPSPPAPIKTLEMTPKRSTRATADKKPKVDTVAKLNKTELKVSLANEVIRNVFQKSKAALNGSEQTDESHLADVKKKGRSKKISCKLQDYSLDLPHIKSPTLKKLNGNVKDVKKNVTGNSDHPKGRRKRTINPGESVADVLESDNTNNETIVSGIAPKRRKLITHKKGTRINSIKQQTITRVLRNTRGKQRKKEAVASNANAKDTSSNKRVLEGKATDEKVTGLVSCRRNSLNSTSTCFSWTKDISSTSTTTCFSVHSNDFVRFDNRLPIIKLTNINHKAYTKNADSRSATVNNDVLSLTESTRLSASETNEVSSVGSVGSVGDLNVPDALNLSTSSVSTEKSNDFSLDATNYKNVSIMKLKQTLDDCASKMKNFDLEMMNWIGYDHENRDTVKIRLHDRVLKELKHENDVIMHCRQIRRILTGHESVVEYANETLGDGNAHDASNKNPSPRKLSDLAHCAMSHHGNVVERNNRIIDQERLERNERNDIARDFSNESDPSTQAREKDDNLENNDDDDALSLYAESLTGLESSRKNTSAASDPEQYIKQMAKSPPRLPEMMSYEAPFNEKDIPEQIEPVINKPERTKTICEKQTADSTSINREIDDNRSNDSQMQHLISKDLANSPCTGVPTMDPIAFLPNISQFSYKQAPGVKSGLFHGVCFSNLISNCKRSSCSYPHVQINVDEVKTALRGLDQDLFVKECLVVRNFRMLRQRYGMCFIEECAQRNLTKLLVETAMYFIVKSNPNVKDNVLLTTEVVERMLLYLNERDLQTFARELVFPISPNVLLCDYLIELISKTQNFTRFKPIFIKLTAFIRHMDRKVSLEVCSNLLERFCILPYDDVLVRAFVEIVKRTDVKILESPMMGLLEKQLLMNSAVLHKEVMEMKMYAAAQGGDTPGAPADPEARYSPDTTHLDSLNRSAEQATAAEPLYCNKMLTFSVSPESLATARARRSFPLPYPRWGEAGRGAFRPRGGGRGWGRPRARGAFLGAPPNFLRGRRYPHNMY